MTYVANVSGGINAELKQKEILEFNSRFEGYANKEKGYLDIKNAISLQEFASICNMVRQWNSGNPSDKVEITIDNGRHKELLRKYANSDSKEPLEDLFTKINKEYGGIENYYFEFTSQNIHYRNETGRVDQISLKMLQKPT